MKLEKMLKLDARSLVKAIAEVTETEVLDDIEDAEHDVENEKRGAGRVTVFRALADRRHELARTNQDLALEQALLDGTLPEEDRRAPEVPDEPETTSVEGPLMEAADEGTQGDAEVVVESTAVVEEVPADVVTGPPPIPNDLIQTVVDRGDGTKVDILGHIIVSV